MMKKISMAVRSWCSWYTYSASVVRGRAARGDLLKRFWSMSIIHERIVIHKWVPALRKSRMPMMSHRAETRNHWCTTCTKLWFRRKTESETQPRGLWAIQWPITGGNNTYYIVRTVQIVICRRRIFKSSVFYWTWSKGSFSCNFTVRLLALDLFVQTIAVSPGSDVGLWRPVVLWPHEFITHVGVPSAEPRTLLGSLCYHSSDNGEKRTRIPYSQSNIVLCTFFSSSSVVLVMSCRIFYNT